MLDRNKLAKQFELVVQQEIKNHQDAVYSTNQAFNDIRNKVEEMSNQSLENYALIVSQHKNLEIEIQLLKEKVDSFMRKFERNINDQSILNERNAIQYEDVVETLEKRIKLEVNFFDRLKDVERHSYEVSESSEALQKTVETNLNSWHSRCMRDMAKLKEEVYSRPSGALEVKKDLEEQIASYRVDVDGIMREINIFKKSTYVVEKKLENIYTQIERMRGGLS